MVNLYDFQKLAKSSESNDYVLKVRVDNLDFQ